MDLQRKCVFLTVALALIIVSVSGQAVDICAICRCNRLQGEVNEVICDCNSQNKVLDITEDKMASVVHIKDFAVTNCTSVNFHKSAFKSAHDLQSVTVSRVHTVIFNVGVFSSLTSLLVEDVSDLQLTRMAFLGATIEDIAIFSSNISVLPGLVLNDIKGLRRVEFKSVVIGLMKASAVKVIMTEHSEFVIDKCEVGTIEKGAIQLEANKLFIRSSYFEDIRSNAVNVSAIQVIRVMKNIFSSNCSSNGLLLKSNKINIEENTFNYLPIGLLTKSKNEPSFISFTKNIVYNFTLMADGVDLSTMLDLNDFVDNEVLCDCDLAKTVLAYKVFQSASAPRTVSERNYCHLTTSSPCKLSLQRLSEEQQQVCDDNATTIDELCVNLPAQSTTMAPPSTRGARVHEMPANTPASRTTTTTSTTTTTTTMMTSHAPNSHHASHQTNSSGTTFSFSAFLTALTVVTSSAKHFFASC